MYEIGVGGISFQELRDIMVGFDKRGYRAYQGCMKIVLEKDGKEFQLSPETSENCDAILLVGSSNKTLPGRTDIHVFDFLDKDRLESF